jgi:hypothetical protein
VQGPALSLLNATFQKLSNFCVVHSQRGAVKSRPKMVYAIPNAEGELPVYDWHQRPEYFGAVEALPQQFEVLFDLVKDRFPLLPQPNHMMLTFHRTGKEGYIPPHRDSSYSEFNAGAFETATPIFLFSFMATRKFCITDLNAPANTHAYKVIAKHVIYEFPFEDGDLFLLQGKQNELVKHCVPQENEVKSLRVSVVMRRCDSMFANLAAGYWTKQGNRYLIKNVKDSDGNPKAAF